MKYPKEEKQEALENLKSWIKKGDTLHTTVKHVSRSGMMRHISVRHLKATDNPERPVYISNYDYHIARVLDLPEAPNYQGVKVGGCGMDMGFHLVYSLSRSLFKDEPKGEGDRDHGYWINQEWL
jgi:hypothetical protein|tara:strand:- start:27 stop:398 length:372 start_codon:yes stop_codon:yes gene_type:complete